MMESKKVISYDRLPFERLERQNSIRLDPYKVMAPVIEEYGPVCTHNMPCAVYGDQPAVLNCNKGIFAPSWKAQKDGYMLVKPPKWLRWLFSKYKI
jgi:hypothetical protein